MEGYEEVWFCDAEGGLVQHEALCKTFEILSVKRQGDIYELAARGDRQAHDRIRQLPPW